HQRPCDPGRTGDASGSVRPVSVRLLQPTPRPDPAFVLRPLRVLAADEAARGRSFRLAARPAAGGGEAIDRTVALVARWHRHRGGAAAPGAAVSERGLTIGEIPWRVVEGRRLFWTRWVGFDSRIR